MVEIKYIACWLVSEGDQPEDEFDPDLCIYERETFADLDKAKLRVIAGDIFDGGTVLEMEYSPFDDGGYGIIDDWTEIGVHRPCGNKWEFDRYETE